jgi:hypothetical protein
MMVRIGSNPIALKVNLFELPVKRAVERLAHINRASRFGSFIWPY